MDTKKPDRPFSGRWNAYVSAGKTKEERLKRLAEAPEHLKESIKSHTKTVFYLRSMKGRLQK